MNGADHVTVAQCLVALARIAQANALLRRLCAQEWIKVGTHVTVVTVLTLALFRHVIITIIACGAVASKVWAWPSVLWAVSFH